MAAEPGSRLPGRPEGETEPDGLTSSDRERPRCRKGWSRIRPALLGALLGGVVGGGIMSWPGMRFAASNRSPWVRESAEGVHRVAGGNEEHYDDDCEDHDHDDPRVIELSLQARRNIGLSVVSVASREFARTITVPAVIAEQPGLTVSAPLSGIVQRIVPLAGEAVAPGAPLMELRLTHDSVVDRQRALLLALEQREVVQREVARLEVARLEVARLAEVAASGAVAGKTLWDGNTSCRRSRRRSGRKGRRWSCMGSACSRWTGSLRTASFWPRSRSQLHRCCQASIIWMTITSSN